MSCIFYWNVGSCPCSNKDWSPCTEYNSWSHLRNAVHNAFHSGSFLSHFWMRALIIYINILIILMSFSTVQGEERRECGAEADSWAWYRCGYCWKHDLCGSNHRVDDYWIDCSVAGNARGCPLWS